MCEVFEMGGNVGFRRCRVQAPDTNWGGWEAVIAGGGRERGGREGRPLDSIAGQAIEDEVLSVRRP